MGSIISIISLFLFIYILYDQFIYGKNYKLIYKIPDFIESNNIFKLNVIKSSSIEFLLNSPPAVHAFNTPAIIS